MTLRVSKAELQKVTTLHLTRDPAFRLIRGMTQDNINLIVDMVLRARRRAIEDLKAQQGEAPKQLDEPAADGLHVRSNEVGMPPKLDEATRQQYIARAAYEASQKAHW